jgi:hypothetical protein
MPQYGRGGGGPVLFWRERASAAAHRNGQEARGPVFIYISTNAVNRVVAACPPSEALSWLVMLSVCRLSPSLPFPSPLAFFSSRAQPIFGAKTFPGGNLRDLCQHFLPCSTSSPLPLPFLSSSSPHPAQEGQEFTYFPDPASLADCHPSPPPPKSPASVAFALLSPPAPILELPLSTTSPLSSHRTLTLTHLPRETCRPQPRASKAIWTDTL